MPVYSEIVSALKAKAATLPAKEKAVLLAFADTLQNKEGQVLKAGSDIVLRALALLSGTGGTDKVKDYIIGSIMSPEELIKGMKGSASVFKAAKPELKAAAETILDVLVSFGAKALFSLWTERAGGK